MSQTKKEAITTVSRILLGAAIGWFIPDVFNFLSTLFGNGNAEIVPLTRFLSTAFGASIGFLISSHISHKRKFNAAIANLRQGMKAEVVSSLEASIDKTIIPLLLDIKSNDPRNVYEISTLVSPLIRYFATKSYGINTANSMVVAEQVIRLQKELDMLNSEGLIVNLNVHLKTTENLVEKCGDRYVQINRHILDVSKEWSADWLKLLGQLATRDIGRSYILLVSEKELIDKRGLIEKLNEKMQKHNFSMKICTVEDLVTTYGRIDLLKYDAIEVFDETVIKTQQFVDGKYIESSKIKMKILNYGDSSWDSGIVKYIITKSKTYMDGMATDTPVLH